MIDGAKGLRQAIQTVFGAQAVVHSRPRSRPRPSSRRRRSPEVHPSRFGFSTKDEIDSTRPGELVCLDAFYVGNLKGVGKVWQLTACDAACSYGAARLVAGPSAAAATGFLREVLVPLYQQAGWRLERVLTDGGEEFKAEFDQACAALGIRHTRTWPRHAWTNGFVERAYADSEAYSPHEMRRILLKRRIRPIISAGGAENVHPRA